MSSMIHSARPTVSTVENIVVGLNLFCLWKVGTDGRHVQKNDHYRPWLWVGLVDQYCNVEFSLRYVNLWCKKICITIAILLYITNFLKSLFCKIFEYRKSKKFFRRNRYFRKFIICKLYYCLPEFENIFSM